MRVKMSKSTNVVIKKGYSPYIGPNGNWFVYDHDEKCFVDSGLYAKGDKGDKGDNGKDCIYTSFNIDKNGHLIYETFSDVQQSTYSIDENGHLILTMEGS